LDLAAAIVGRGDGVSPAEDVIGRTAAELRGRFTSAPYGEEAVPDGHVAIRFDRPCVAGEHVRWIEDPPEQARAAKAAAYAANTVPPLCGGYVLFVRPWPP